MITILKKRYSDLKQLNTFKERFDYLNLHGSVGADTFGFDRYLNQTLYRSNQWKHLRNQIILRDNGCDLGIEDREIQEKIIVHHINPICVEDILNENPIVYDPENLISMSVETHNAIHYGNYENVNKEITIRTKDDTCPWRL